MEQVWASVVAMFEPPPRPSVNSAHQPDTLLHGDLQGSNAPRSPDGGWAVIDPLGLVGEPALEALTSLRDRWSDLPLRPSPRVELFRRLHAFADAAGAP